jgi:hypothetical protein
MSDHPSSLAPPARRLLQRILEQPALVGAVQRLDARALAHVVERVGLEDSGELIALATTEQLRGVLDEDLWRSARPGGDETFDGARFSLWLQVLLEAGEAFAAQKLSELPEELLTLALQQQLFVLNLDELVVEFADRKDDAAALAEKALESCVYQELDEYRLIARRPDGWDALLSVVLALDQDHHDLLHRILERCCDASATEIADGGGLYQVLTAAETLAADAAAEREDRRARAGYVAPSQAAAFLALARTTPLVELERSETRDPITRAYFREYQAPELLSDLQEVDEDVRRLEALVAELAPPDDAAAAGRATPRARRLAGAGAATVETLFQGAMLELSSRDLEAHEARMQELSYLANVLLAGCPLGDGAFRPFEAAEAVLAACNLGLERLSRSKPAGELLGRTPAERLFRIGWHLWHHELCIPAARAAERMLRRGAASDGGRAADALAAAIAAGKPWSARRPLRALAPSLRALVAECPTTAGASGGRFFATWNQIRIARNEIDRA